MAEEDKLDDLPPPPPPPPHGFEHFLRHNPMAAVLGALVVGVVLGKIGLL